MKISALLHDFMPEHDFVTLGGKIKSGLAATGGIFLLGMAVKFLPQAHYPTVMLASMAASAVLLYAAPHSPMAQPWPLIGGHFISALCGWLVAHMVADPIAAASVTVGLAIFAMSVLRCLHPPGGATALIMVLNYEAYREFGWQWVGYVVLLNALSSLLAALAINNLIKGRRYPTKRPDTHVSTAPLTTATQISSSDIERALIQIDSMIDVSEEDLLTIYEMASKNAKEGNKISRD